MTFNQSNVQNAGAWAVANGANIIDAALPTYSTNPSGFDWLTVYFDYIASTTWQLVTASAGITRGLDRPLVARRRLERARRRLPGGSGTPTANHARAPARPRMPTDTSNYFTTILTTPSPTCWPKAQRLQHHQQQPMDRLRRLRSGLRQPDGVRRSGSGRRGRSADPGQLQLFEGLARSASCPHNRRR